MRCASDHASAPVGQRTVVDVMLMERDGHLIARTTFLPGRDASVSGSRARTADVHVVRLRSKLGATGVVETARVVIRRLQNAVPSAAPPGVPPAAP